MTTTPLSPFTLLLPLALACGTGADTTNPEDTGFDYCDTTGSVAPEPYYAAVEDWYCDYKEAQAESVGSTYDRCPEDVQEAIDHLLYNNSRLKNGACIDAANACQCIGWMDENPEVPSASNADIALTYDLPYNCAFPDVIFACPPS